MVKPNFLIQKTKNIMLERQKSYIMVLKLTIFKRYKSFANLYYLQFCILLIHKFTIFLKLMYLL